MNGDDEGVASRRYVVLQCNGCRAKVAVYSAMVGAWCEICGVAMLIVDEREDGQPL